MIKRKKLEKLLEKILNEKKYNRSLEKKEKTGKKNYF